MPLPPLCQLLRGVRATVDSLGVKCACAGDLAFSDQKGEVGLSHWEGRSWMGLQRHLVLTSVSHLFLAIACKKLRGKNPEVTVC
jgi:hypothetical protein